MKSKVASVYTPTMTFTEVVITTGGQKALVTKSSLPPSALLTISFQIRAVCHYSSKSFSSVRLCSCAYSILGLKTALNGL